MSGNKKIKVRSTYQYAPGLSTVLHYPQEVEIKHEAFTCAPRKVRIKFKYEWSPGLHTTMEHPQRIVLKHYVYKYHPIRIYRVNNVRITGIGPSFRL